MKQLLSFIFVTLTIMSFGQVKQKQNLKAFLPKGYVIFEKIKGDLNKDAIEDCVLIIKGTDKSKIVINDYNEKVDRNRRGIIVLFGKKDHYELAVKNYDCFSSENEDGGNYMPPELFIEIKKGNLCIHYGHGRYGYWRYLFRFQNPDFELIGYESSENHGPIVYEQTSINFLTKKKIIRENINIYKDGEKEIFKETLKNINVNSSIKLSKIKDIDELDMDIY